MILCTRNEMIAFRSRQYGNAIDIFILLLLLLLLLCSFGSHARVNDLLAVVQHKKAT